MQKENQVLTLIEGKVKYDNSIIKMLVGKHPLNHKTKTERKRRFSNPHT